MSSFLFFFYDILFFLCFVLYLPIGFLRRKLSFEALGQKFGLMGVPRLKGCAWIQAVSVGEVILAARLIERLKANYGYPVVLTTTTLAGHNAAKQRYGKSVILVYFPYDISFIVTKFIACLRPKIFIALETELWPNLFRILKDYRVPVVVVNGRISDRAFRRYRLIKWLTRSVLSCCDFIGAQNEQYYKRFIALGADPQKIAVTGNIKFENVACDEERLTKIKEQFLPLLKGSYRLLLLAASTHDPEEGIILDIYQDIVKNYHNVTLLIAPRHLERIPAIEKLVRNNGFVPQRITTAHTLLATNEKVYILDTIGELVYFYAISDVCFVGGSMVNHGGHNILEPVFFNKPTCFGPHMQNFRDIEKTVLDKKAALKAADAGDLKQVIIQLVSSSSVRAELAANSRQVFGQGKSFLDQNFEAISRCFK